MATTQIELPPFLFARTKLHPPRLRNDTLPRPRLVEKIRRALTNVRLVLVSAPAGYGKTTLVANAVSQVSGANLAWVSLDSEENEPLRFLHALIFALQPFTPTVATSVLAKLADTGDESNPRVLGRMVVTALLNELFERETPLCLVLDDLHYVTHVDVHATLNFLVERLPPHVTLVIATRHDPGLSLAQLRARREMVELRLEELRFTHDEAAGLLNHQLGLALSSDDLAALMKRTDGWAAGMTLLSASLERITTPAARTLFVDQLAHSNRYIFDYLAESVLNREDATIRTFLIETSIFDELEPTLCAAVTGRSDAELILQELFRRNLFIIALESTSTTHTFYRYHDLFRDFLREQLRRQPIERVRELHLRAAETIEQQSREIDHTHKPYSALVYHYEQAQAWDKTFQVAQLAAEQAKQFYAYPSVLEHYQRAFRAANQLQPIPNLLTLFLERGKVYDHLGNFEASANDLVAALALAEAQNEQGVIARIQLALSALWVSSDYRKARMQLEEAIQRARQEQDLSTLANSLNLLGGILVQERNLADAQSAHQEALTIFRSLDDRRGIALIIDQMGRARQQMGDCLGSIKLLQQAGQQWRAIHAQKELAQNLWLQALTIEYDTEVRATTDLKNCIACAEEALELFCTIGNREGEASALMMIGLVAGHFGDYGRALRFAHEALALTREVESRHYEAQVLAVLGFLYGSLLATAEAQRNLEQARQLAQAIGSQIVVAHVADLLAPIYAQHGMWRQAQAIFDEMLPANASFSESLARQIRCAQVEVALLKQDAPLALSICEQLIANTVNLDSTTVIPRLWLLKGEALNLANRWIEAEQILQAARETASQQGLRPLLWRIHLVLGKNYQAQTRNDLAQSEFDLSRELVQTLANTIDDLPVCSHFVAQTSALSQPMMPLNLVAATTFRVPDTGETLTERELEVLRLIATGADNAAIASELIVSIHTVKTHVVHILSKLGVSSRMQAAYRAKELGIIK